VAAPHFGAGRRADREGFGEVCSGHPVSSDLSGAEGNPRRRFENGRVGWIVKYYGC
jgi:hypothetical protein